MRRKFYFWFFVIAVLAVTEMTEAQQAKKIFRVGYLSSGNPTSESKRSEVIRQRLRELSYIEGQNIALEFRYTEGKLDRANELVADLVRLKVDVIVVAGGGNWVRAAMNGTKTIPIVMAAPATDPVEAGLIDSLARPGGNVTGVSNLARELGGKRLEILKDAIGKVTRVAVLYDPTVSGIALEVTRDLPVAARALKLTLQPWKVRDARDLDSALGAMSKQRPEALYAPLPVGLMFPNRKRILDFALKSRLPTMYSSIESVEAGGLMFYGADVAESHRQVAWYVDRILKGTKPQELPVQQPMRFEFVVNLQAATKIGVTINTDVLARATKIIR